MTLPRLNGAGKYLGVGAASVLASVGSVFGALETRFSALSGRIDSCNQAVAEARLGMAQAREGQLTLKERVTSLETRIESVRLAPTGISAETRPRIEGLERAVEALRGELRELERRQP